MANNKKQIARSEADAKTLDFIKGVARDRGFTLSDEQAIACLSSAKREVNVDSSEFYYWLKSYFC